MVLEGLAQGESVGCAGKCGEGSLHECGHDDAGVLDLSGVTLDVGRVGDGASGTVGRFGAGNGAGSVDDVAHELDLGVALESCEGLVGSAELLCDVVPDLGGVHDVLTDFTIPNGDVKAPCEVDDVELANGGGVAEGDTPSGVLCVDGSVDESDMLETGSVGHAALLEVGIEVAVLDPGLVDDDLGDLRDETLHGGDVCELGCGRLFLEGHERLIRPYSGCDFLSSESIEVTHLLTLLS